MYVNKITILDKEWLESLITINIYVVYDLYFV